MTPRPIHKWKTFWLGLLILAFLTWTWSRSRSQNDYLGVGTIAKTWIHAGSWNGALRMVVLKSTHPTTTTNSFEINSLPMDTVRPWFEAPFKAKRTVRPKLITYELGIAHWLIILLFFLTWSTLLLRRARRLRRLTDPPQQAAPAPPC
ncbi:MAG: hypothetical protein EOP87_24655 [Verrucomicrobiaceae bacterium]|nr:MAG: hypothetical protein EOP87_24655 [Verrucomicrobiaceae bacterium]